LVGALPIVLAFNNALVVFAGSFSAGLLSVALRSAPAILANPSGAASVIAALRRNAVLALADFVIGAVPVLAAFFHQQWVHNRALSTHAGCAIQATLIRSAFNAQVDEARFTSHPQSSK
jgi:hypothetical protein